MPSEINDLRDVFNLERDSLLLLSVSLRMFRLGSSAIADRILADVLQEQLDRALIKKPKN